MDDWVFVDTCVWASFFAKPGSAEKAAVDRLLDQDRVAIVGPIVAEVLLGFRIRQQADWVASRLHLAHYVDLDWNDWRNAAELGRTTAARGHKLPLTDLVVAAVAMERNASVYTTDPHFHHIDGLQRHEPIGD